MTESVVPHQMTYTGDGILECETCPRKVRITGDPLCVQVLIRGDERAPHSMSGGLRVDVKLDTEQNE